MMSATTQNSLKASLSLEQISILPLTDIAPQSPVPTCLIEFLPVTEIPTPPLLLPEIASLSLTSEESSLLGTENSVLVIALEPEPSAPIIVTVDECLLKPTTPIVTEMTCNICTSTFPATETYLKCVNQKCEKLTCNQCVNLMLNVMFGQPALHYPLRCGSCASNFKSNEVEGVLAQHECYEKFISCVLPLFWSSDCLRENEELVRCPFCPYIEIHTTDACPIQFLNCQHPSCKKKSCLICLHAINDDADKIVHQLQCSELDKYQRIIRNAIEQGSKQKCPGCELTGIKDDGCTHMGCQLCGESWCYLCGQSEQECLVDEYATPSFSEHNKDWETNEGRCPMYLSSIHEVDDRWPYDDTNCLEYFHRFRTLRLLYEVMIEIGKDTLYELNDKFNIIDATGYTIQEIEESSNTALINYRTRDDDC